jgi:hypothetical protein
VPKSDWRAKLAHAEARAATEGTQGTSEAGHVSAPAPGRFEPAAARTGASGDGAPATAMASAVVTAGPAATTNAAAAEETEAAPDWRGPLCDWAAMVLVHPRSARPLPSEERPTLLDAAAARLGLGPLATRALALLYGARLLGEHDGVPAATVARALASTLETGAPDGDAWAEALGQGPLSQRGLVRAHRGRLLLRMTAARFLDGAAAGVPIFAATGRDAPPVAGAVRMDGDSEPLALLAARLSNRYGCAVAMLALSGTATARTLATGLCEARLRGAWPLIEGPDDTAMWIDALDGGPAVIVVRGAVPPALAMLPAF